MRKTLIVVIICLLMAGCGVGNGGSTMGDLEKEVFPVVDKYLENAALGNWKEVYETLSGEALAETKANTGRVKISEKIVTKTFFLSPVCKDIVEVTADFTKSSAQGFDRVAYCFRLKKNDGRWLIYNTTMGQYIHGELKSEKLPPDAAHTVKAYFELPFNEKRANDHKYLAGMLLQESRKAGLLPVKEQDKIKTTITSVESMGITDGYVVALVTCDVYKDGKIYTEEIVADILNVNGLWKICRIDITNIDNKGG